AGFGIEGKPVAEIPGSRTAQFQSIGAGYFQTMHIPLIDGRDFSDGDTDATERVAIISQRLAQLYFPGENSIGKRIRAGTDDSPGPWMTVVGIVRDVKNDPYRRESESVIYRPFRQAAPLYSCLVVRASVDPTSLIPSVRNRIAAVDPEQPVFDIKTLYRVI